MSEKMDGCVCSVQKKTLYIKEWMAQADSPKEARTFERTNGRSLFKQMIYYFKESTIEKCLLPL